MTTRDGRACSVRAHFRRRRIVRCSTQRGIHARARTARWPRERQAKSFIKRPACGLHWHFDRRCRCHDLPVASQARRCVGEHRNRCASETRTGRRFARCAANARDTRSRQCERHLLQRPNRQPRASSKATRPHPLSNNSNPRRSLRSAHSPWSFRLRPSRRGPRLQQIRRAQRKRRWLLRPQRSQASRFVEAACARGQWQASQDGSQYIEDTEARQQQRRTDGIASQQARSRHRPADRPPQAQQGTGPRTATSALAEVAADCKSGQRCKP
jgi:hypothetical protein